MTHRELAVLEALNIASAIHSRPVRDGERIFQATAAQIAEALNTDDYVQGAYGRTHTPAEVGSTLGRMAKGWPYRRAALVERVNTRRWRLADAGLEAMSA